MKTESIEAYLRDGCGRCDKHATPDCKVRRWPDTLRAARQVLQQTQLVETMKWGAPCYTVDGKNVLMLTALVDHVSIGFFKGALLDDPDGLLVKPGPNSQAARNLNLTSADQVAASRPAIEGFVAQAIEAERAGKTVTFRSDEPVPAELEAVLVGDPAVRAAFDALTPGRRRSYILHVSGAKKAPTREARAERCVPKILSGKGFNER